MITRKRLQSRISLRLLLLAKHSAPSGFLNVPRVRFRRLRSQALQPQGSTRFRRDRGDQCGLTRIDHPQSAGIAYLPASAASGETQCSLRLPQGTSGTLSSPHVVSLLTTISYAISPRSGWSFRANRHKPLRNRDDKQKRPGRVARSFVLTLLWRTYMACVASPKSVGK